MPVIVGGRTSSIRARSPSVCGPPYTSTDNAESLAAVSNVFLGMTESAVKVAVHRLRKRFGLLLREEVERTVGDPGETEGELRFLLAALG